MNNLQEDLDEMMEREKEEQKKQQFTISHDTDSESNFESESEETFFNQELQNNEEQIEPPKVNDVFKPNLLPVFMTDI